jgi:hypothetical protein
LLGVEDGAAIAGMRRFRMARQYEASSLSDGRGAASIAATSEGIEATVWSAELKKQVFPTFGRVWLKRFPPGRSSAAGFEFVERECWSACTAAGNILTASLVGTGS